MTNSLLEPEKEKKSLIEVQSDSKSDSSTDSNSSSDHVISPVMTVSVMTPESIEDG